jgi:hypothetical protein
VLLSPTSPLRKRRIGDADRAYEAYLARGFPTADFVGQPEPETLQCRHELDRTNWLGLVMMCQLAIAAGLGDDLAAGTIIRCTSNREYAITPNDALARMVALLGLADLAQRNWWRLKDECRSVTTTQALEAIDMGAGWP